MPQDEEGREYVWLNAESIHDSRLRQLGNDQYWFAICLFIAAGREGRRGWLPIAEGETAADALAAAIPPSRDGRVTPVRPQAALDRFEQLGFVSIEPGRICVTAPELVSYDAEPGDVTLLDFHREQRAPRRDEGIDS